MWVILMERIWSETDFSFLVQSCCSDQSMFILSWEMIFNSVDCGNNHLCSFLIFQHLAGQTIRKHLFLIRRVFSPRSLTFSPWKFNSIIQYALHFLSFGTHTHTHTHTVWTQACTHTRWVQGYMIYGLWLLLVGNVFSYWQLTCIFPHILF